MNLIRRTLEKIQANESYLPLAAMCAVICAAIEGATCPNIVGRRPLTEAAMHPCWAVANASFFITGGLFASASYIFT